MQNSDSQSLGVPLSIDEDGVKKYLQDVLHEKKRRDDKKEDKEY
jgi:hypothetical protein